MTVRSGLPAAGPAPARAVILKPCCLGDALMATALAAALKAAWPATRLDFAVGRHSRPALAGNPDVADVVDASGCLRGERPALAGPRLAWRLRRRRYGVAFVPDRSPITAVIARLAGIGVRVGLDSGGRGRWHTVRVPVPPDRHELLLYLDLARAAGVPVPDRPRPVFVPSAGDHARAAALLADAAGGPAGTRVAIHPGGGVNPGMTLLGKRWPPERFAAVADGLASGGAGIVLLGGPGDRAAVDAVQAALAPATRQRTLDAAGRLSLGEVAAVIGRCDLYVGNDTGVTHLAAAVGTPVVAVFGPTRPDRYGPLPGTGVAVAPAGDGPPAADDLAAAAGSTAILGVPVDAVAAACARLLRP